MKESLVKLAASIAYTVSAVFIRTITFMTLWEWFIQGYFISFNLSFPHAAGVLILAKFIKGSPKKLEGEKHADEYAKEVAVLFFYSVLVLGVSYAIKSFM